MTMRSLSILGATGSVGTTTLDLVSHHDGRFAVDTLTANTDVAGLVQLAILHRARHAVIADPDLYQDLKDALAGTDTSAAAGSDALCEAARRPVDLLMAAIVGIAGLAPTVTAIQSQKCVALANKETLVSAGSFVMSEVRRCGTLLIPVDSEHSALLQALGGAAFLDNPDYAQVDDLVITASGGPFREMPLHELQNVTRQQALAHPVWSMGAKISIDSATMMNKALELIEARHLFAIAPDRLRVLVHPQSIIHGLVRFCDGSVVAQMAQPDMQVPIALALAWPERIETQAPRLDLADLGHLTFEPPDEVRFPALRLAREVMACDNAAATILNGANEYAVAAYLAGQGAFHDIVGLCEATLDALDGTNIGAPASVSDALELDARARSVAKELAARPAPG